jgi:uncharacterized membrane protein HdeD (DUF308 family)
MSTKQRDVAGIPTKLAWQLQLLAGAITLVLGIVLTAHPTGSLNVVAIVLGIALVVSAVFHFIRMLDHDEQHRVWIGVAGVIELVVGVVLIRHLGLTRALIGLFIGISWIIQGVVALFAGVLGQPGRSRVWPILFGLISIVAGAIVVAIPGGSVTVLMTIFGIWLIVMGGLEIVLGLVVRSEAKQA